MDERTLVALFFARDEAAISQTARLYGRYAYRIAFNILSSAEDTEEVVNDVYERLWETIPPSDPRDFMAYLAKITRNLAYNKLESRNADKRKTVGLLALDELSEVIAEGDEDLTDKIALSRALDQFLASLEKNDRILFVKRYFYNESLDSLARAFKTTRGAVKVKLYRLRKDLKRRLLSEGVFVKE